MLPCGWNRTTALGVACPPRVVCCPRTLERTQAQPLRRADDPTLTVQLQPGVPVRVDMAWEFDAGESVRMPPTWGLYARRFVERGYLQGEGGAGWKQDAPLARIVLDPGPPPEAG